MKYDAAMFRMLIDGAKPRSTGPTTVVLRDALRAAVDEAERLRAEVVCAKRPRTVSLYSCGCTDRSACEDHAEGLKYAKCPACGEYEVPFSELARAANSHP